MKIVWLLSFFISSLFIVQLSVSEELKNHNIGFFLGVNYNNHSADFFKLKGIPNCCPRFETGYGSGFNSGLFYERDLNSFLFIGNRLGLMTLDGELVNDEEVTIITEDGPDKAVFEHSLTGSFLSFYIEPYISIKITKNMKFSLGTRIGSNLTSNYSQVETIKSPFGFGSYIDSSGNEQRTWNKNSGEIPEAKRLQAHIVGSLSYDLPLNHSNSVFLTPIVSYYHPLTNLANNTDWSVANLTAVLAIKINIDELMRNDVIINQEYNIDTITIQSDLVNESLFSKGKEVSDTNSKEEEGLVLETEIISRTDTLFTPKVYKLEGYITAVGVDSQGNEIPNPVFKIEEFVFNRLDPLLNYVFFDEDDSNIPVRYFQLPKYETSSFEIDSLYYDNTLEIYHNILNIIGKRLTLHKDATITLVGCNSNIENEENNTKLSRDRAKKIKIYLINTWEIDEDRINIEVRNLPQKESTPIDETEKAQENRRVEILSDNNKILEPVYIKKIEYTANPAIARFKIESKCDLPIKEWKLTAYQDNYSDLNLTKSGKGNVPQNIEWSIDSKQKTIPLLQQSIIYSMLIKDVRDSSCKIENKTLPIKVISTQEKTINNTDDFIVERFSLILFDFNKSEITGTNKNIIELIKSKIQNNSIIEVKGYTDRTGVNNYNRNLSNNRVNETIKAIDRKDTKGMAIGEDILLWDNELPEGRFYCRTVVITVKTPIEGNKK